MKQAIHSVISKTDSGTGSLSKNKLFCLNMNPAEDLWVLKVARRHSSMTNVYLVGMVDSVIMVNHMDIVTLVDMVDNMNMVDDVNMVDSKDLMIFCNL